MRCLKDYIGLKWCGNTSTPGSGLYINQLPGISLKSIDGLANAEQVTFINVWDDAQERAIVALNTAVQNHFAKHYRLNRIAESVTLGKNINTAENQTAAAAEYRGLTVNTGNSSSPFATIYIQTLLYYAKADTAAVTIKFFDIQDQDNATVVKTLTQDMVAGWNSIIVNESFEVQKLFIAYDATAIESPYSSLNDNYPHPFTELCCDFCIGNTCAYIRGAKSTNPYADLDEGVNTFGLAGTFSVQCSFNSLVCANKNVFASAFWYLLGAELMSERIYSDRVNRYTTVDIDKARELYSNFIDKANTELANAIEGIRFNCDECATADATVTYVESLP